jgi:dUTP pyrophosphatase
MSQDINLPKVLFIKTHKDAKTPTRTYFNDTGYDLYACEDIKIKATIPTIIPTGIRMAFPKGYYGEMHTRSSWGLKGIRVHLGILDEGYRQEISPIVIAPNDIYVRKGSRVAQLVIRKRIDVEMYETDFLPTSERGEKGFGSSGI